MKETLDKLRMHSFYGRISIEEMNKELPEAPTVPELIETIIQQQKTIMLYQEALEDMTAHRNELERELRWIYNKIDAMHKEFIT